MYQIVILSKLALILGQVIFRRFRIFKCKAYFGTNHVSLFFFKILYCIFYSCYIFMWRFFRSNWEVRPLPRRLVLIWVNCLEGILITHFFFFCYISGALCYFILAQQFIRFLCMSLFCLIKRFLIHISTNLFYKMELLRSYRF